MMKKLTLRDISQLANVSPATVSRVINHYPHIRPEVRERVEKVIAETGYEPNLLARSLASDRSNMIGLIIPSNANAVLLDPYFPALLKGVFQATNQAHLTVALFLFESHAEEERSIKTILNTGFLDGLIFTADRKKDSFISECLEAEMPLILIGRPEHSADKITYVDADNEMGGFLATEHLIKLGHRRVATVAVAQNTAGDDRMAGYLRAMRQYGLAIDEQLIAYGNYSMDSSYKAMQQIIPHQPEAVFVTSDTMSLGALRAIREAGLRVPEDIALVSFDDLPHAQQAQPRLTSVRQPIERSGYESVELLRGIINNPTIEPRRTVFPVELIIRESCGAVAS